MYSDITEKKQKPEQGWTTEDKLPRDVNMIKGRIVSSSATGVHSLIAA